jgi:dolichyl-phosphate-mannose-protein mannosyltransferase
MRGIKGFLIANLHLDGRESRRNSHLCRRDLEIALLFFAVSFLTRAFNFKVPQEVVFDEAHFGTFINNYISRRFYFDIHPPLAKLILFASARLLGYDGGADFLSRYSPAGYPFYCYLRLVPAFWGSFISPLIFLALRAADAPLLLSCAGGLMCCLDLCLICESRYILSDGILHMFGALTIFTSFFLETFPFCTPDWWVWLCLASLSCGCVVSCKHTALGVVAFCVSFHLFGTLRNQQCFLDIFTLREFLTRLSTLGCLSALVYISSFAVHFALTTHWNDDAVYVTERFERSLIRDNSTVAPMGVFDKFVEMNLLIIENNMKIPSYHPWASSWWTWPLMLSHGTLFWEEGNRHVWSVGTPFVWIASSLGLALGVFAVATGARNSATIVATTIGWAFSFFPFALVPRSTWNYHYLIPLLFAVVGTVIAAAAVGPADGIAITAIVATLIAFLWVAPVVYGIPVTNDTFHLPFEAWRRANPDL